MSQKEQNIREKAERKAFGTFSVTESLVFFWKVTVEYFFQQNYFRCGKFRILTNVNI
ncbi:MAG: hypothetical protein K2N51_05285 [Lachnospiraceae bacterium]|nr:hypothetical protein [Lachnospiraceae bacterium]